MLVLTAAMPQPMSTPTAAGMMAPTVGMTLPTVAPIPQCTSGMIATCLWMNGRRATVSIWRRAASSIGTPCVHALIGAPPVSMYSNPLIFRSKTARLEVMVGCKDLNLGPASCYKLPAATQRSRHDQAVLCREYLLAGLAHRLG